VRCLPPSFIIHFLIDGVLRRPKHSSLRHFFLFRLSTLVGAWPRAQGIRTTGEGLLVLCFSHPALQKASAHDKVIEKNNDGNEANLPRRHVDGREGYGAIWKLA